MHPEDFGGRMIDPADRQKVYSVLESRCDDFVRELSEYVRIATISAHGAMFQEGADATRKILESHGAKVRLLPEEGGPPVVVIDFREVEPSCTPRPSVDA